jgi:hypothetical protein
MSQNYLLFRSMKKQGYTMHSEFYFWDSSVSTIEDAFSTTLEMNKFTWFVLTLEAVSVSSMNST